ncbi:MAG: ribonuclease HI family protein [Acidobacteriaceae bacterium]
MRLESIKLGHMTPVSDRIHADAQSSIFPNDSARKPATSNWAIAYTDGGSRGNPGPSGYGVVIQADNGSILAELSEFLGMRTNNVAEYSGLLAALEFALANCIPRLRVVSDSELMVKQIRGQYRVQSPDLRPLYEQAKRSIAKLEAFQIEHVLRGKNKKADELANLAMDRGMRRKSELKTTTVASSNAATNAEAPPVRPLRGIVKDGRINLLEGSIPEGTIVVVMPEKALGQRAGRF